MLAAARSMSAFALRRARFPTHVTRYAPGSLAPLARRAVASPLCAASEAAAKGPATPAGGDAKAPYPPLKVTAPGRVVALGDVHGDIGQARRALSIAGVLGDGGDAVNPEWTGGDTVVVQVGDVLDRGDDEIAILILLQKLHKQAEAQGGAVYILNGNHEVLNVSGDFRYVTQGAFQESMRFGEHLVNLFGSAFKEAFGGGEDDPRKKQVKARVGPVLPRRTPGAAARDEQHGADRQRHRLCARRLDAPARRVRFGAAEQRCGGLDARRGDFLGGGSHRAGHGHRKREGQRGVEPHVRDGELRHGQRQGQGVRGAR
jgi:hypothetical protein